MHCQQPFVLNNGTTTTTTRTTNTNYTALLPLGYVCAILSRVRRSLRKTNLNSSNLYSSPGFLSVAPATLSFFLHGKKPSVLEKHLIATPGIRRNSSILATLF